MDENNQVADDDSLENDAGYQSFLESVMGGEDATNARRPASRSASKRRIRSAALIDTLQSEQQANAVLSESERDLARRAKAQKTMTRALQAAQDVLDTSEQLSHIRIAKKLNIPVSRVKEYLNETLQDLADHRHAQGKLYLEKHLSDLEIAIETLLPYVYRASPKHTSLYLKALDQRAKLLDFYHEDKASNAPIIINWNSAPIAPQQHDPTITVDALPAPHDYPSLDAIEHLLNADAPDEQ